MLNDLQIKIIEDIVKELASIHDHDALKFWMIIQNIIKDVVIEEDLQTSLKWYKQLKDIRNGK